MGGRQLHLSGQDASIARRFALRSFPLVLLILALLPRLVAINRYVTPDEPVWVYRSVQFREALLDGRWADTLVAGHPGVTTSWLGAAGLTAQRWLSPAARADYEWVTRLARLAPENAEAFRHLGALLTGGRVAVALVNSLAVVAIYMLVRLLSGERTAVVAGLLLALDPYLAGLSGLLHVDGLSASFATLALLLLAAGLRPTISGLSAAWRWMALSGAMAALAVLSKSPTLVLLPVCALGLLWPVVRDGGLSWRDRLIGLLGRGVVWGVAFALTLFLVFPALWAAPSDVLATVSGSANRHLDEALRETFFMGRVAFDHGPLFYPIVLLWRLSPVVWLALIPAGWLWLRTKRAGGQAGRSAASASAVTGVLLGIWVAVFLIAITPAAKKFDRYILPVVPAFLLLAALVWAQWAGHATRYRRWIVPVLIAAQALFWLAHAGFPLAAYNPLAGGGRIAAQVLPAGWGESVSASGKWLAETQPDAAAARAMAGIIPSLAPFFPGQVLVQGVDDLATAEYLIITAGGRQLDPISTAAEIRGMELLHTVRFAGLDQAWIYRLADPQSPPVLPMLTPEVSFGDRLSLASLDTHLENGTIQVALEWRQLITAAPDSRFTLRLAVVDAAGATWAATETDLLNQTDFHPADWTAGASGVVRHTLELSPATPPGQYNLQLALIDTATGSRLPVRIGDGEVAGVTYAAGKIGVQLPPTIVSASRLQIAEASGATWSDGALQLLGHGEVPAEALAGSDLSLEMFWHAPVGNLPEGLAVAFSLKTPAGVDMPLTSGPMSRFDTGKWRTGETIHEQYLVPIPPATIPGRYTVVVQPQSASGEALGPGEALAEITINNIDRAYELPDGVEWPLDDCFGEIVCLRGANTDSGLDVVAGQDVELTLLWQAAEEPRAVYSAFVHLLDATGQTMLNADHWPGGLPSDIWDTGQVIIDRVPLALPTDLPAGRYTLDVGLYSADDGRRLPLANGDDHLLLPFALNISPP